MDTDFSYMITFSNLVLKLNNGEDVSEECEQIKSFSPEDQETIVRQLLSMLDRQEGEHESKIVDALKEIAFLDSNYVDDFASMIHLRSDTSDREQKQQILRQVISREGYTKTILETEFWRTLTLITINAGDNDLLEQFIQKLEQAAKSIAE